MAFYGDATQSTWNTGDGSDIRTEGSFDHVYDQPGEYVVELTTTDPEGVKHTTKTTIVVKSPSAVGSIPNVFTPNGDGMNDLFKIEGEKLTQLEVAVFNKAGKQVYRWNGPDGGWDGRLLSGETAPEGTYFYVIFARGADERSYQYKGTITLIR
jgi:gliding motility-associated-like protein